MVTDFVYYHRARYADTDQMGVVYHGRYFEWFEAARTEMLRAMGVAYKEVERSGIIMPVIEAVCRYKIPVTYDENVGVQVSVGELTRAKLRLDYSVMGEEAKLRASGHTLHCFLKAGRPVRIPDHLEKILKNFN